MVLHRDTQPSFPPCFLLGRCCPGVPRHGRPQGRSLCYLSALPRSSSGTARHVPVGSTQLPQRQSGSQGWGIYLSGPTTRRKHTAKQRDVQCFALSPSSLPFCHPNTASLAAGLCAQSQCLAKQGEEGIGKSA